MYTPINPNYLTLLSVNTIFFSSGNSTVSNSALAYSCLCPDRGRCQNEYSVKLVTDHLFIWDISGHKCTALFYWLCPSCISVRPSGCWDSLQQPHEPGQEQEALQQMDGWMAAHQLPSSSSSWKSSGSHEFEATSALLFWCGLFVKKKEVMWW